MVERRAISRFGRPTSLLQSAKHGTAYGSSEQTVKPAEGGGYLRERFISGTSRKPSVVRRPLFDHGRAELGRWMGQPRCISPDPSTGSVLRRSVLAIIGTSKSIRPVVVNEIPHVPDAVQRVLQRLAPGYLPPSEIESLASGTPYLSYEVVDRHGPVQRLEQREESGL